MTGMQQALMGGGTRVSFVIGQVQDIRATPTPSSGSVAFNSDGTISYTGGASSGSNAWISPAFAGVGSSYWVRFVVNSGTAPTGSAVATTLALSSNQTWTWANASLGVKVANCTITVYADAGATIALASSTFPVDVESN